MASKLHQINQYIDTWKQRCYTNDIPDEAPNEIFDKVPSYKKIAIAILNNDLRELGIKGKESVYYGAFKRIELAERKTKPIIKQLTLL